ncbi:cell wall protein DAN4-like, partial [Varroa jacobsoni]|uniref:cell wall protein DAN4-like n=1 Tax=Varroa jacobsoni TaxID=62625 RepID=UPI000BF9A7A9
ITTTPYTLTVSPAVSSTYSITAISNATCSGTFSGTATVTVKTLPTATVSGTAAICSGGNTTVSIALTGAQPWNFTYTDGTTSTNVTGQATSSYTFSVSPASSKTYSVTTISDINCTGTQSGSAVVTVAAPVTA